MIRRRAQAARTALAGVDAPVQGDGGVADHPRAASRDLDPGQLQPCTGGRLRTVTLTRDTRGLSSATPASTSATRSDKQIFRPCTAAIASLAMR